MTVGLNDSVLLAKLLHPKFVEDFDDHQLIAKRLKTFHRKERIWTLLSTHYLFHYIHYLPLIRNL